MLIGLAGKGGSGKSTLAQFLAKKLPGQNHILSFSTALKEEIHEYFGISPDFQRSAKGKTTLVVLGYRGYTIRAIMQWWGTEIRRAQDPQYWVNKLADKVRDIRKDGQEHNIIVDDVRFKNEVRIINALGGYVFRIKPYEGWAPIAGTTHQSETDLDDMLLTTLTPEFGKLEETADDLIRRLF